MQRNIGFMFATFAGCIILARADQQCVLESGSTFTAPGGAATSSSGSFTWADPVQVPDPHAPRGFVLGVPTPGRQRLRWPASNPKEQDLSPLRHISLTSRLQADS